MMEQPTKLLVQLSVLSMLQKGDKLDTGDVIRIDRREPGEWHYWQSMARYTGRQNRHMNVQHLESLLSDAINQCKKLVQAWVDLNNQDETDQVKVFEHKQLIERIILAISKANTGLVNLIHTYMEIKHTDTVARIKVLRGTIDYHLECIQRIFPSPT